MWLEMVLYSFKIRMDSNPEWHIELKAKVKSSMRHMKGILRAGIFERRFEIQA